MQSWSQTEIDDALVKLAEDPLAIKWMKRPPRVLQFEAVTRNWRAIEFIRHADVDLQMMAIEKDPVNAFRRIRNIHPEAKVKACAVRGMNLKEFKNPTRAMIYAAVTNDGNAIVYAQEQTEELQLIALRSAPMSFHYFTRPSKTVRKIAIERYPENIQYIRNPTTVEQLYVMNKNHYLIRSIHRPCTEALVIAVSKEPSYYLKLKNPPEAVSIEYVKHGESNISRVKNPSRAVKWSAIMNQPKSINYIKDPTQEMVMTSIICG